MPCVLAPVRQGYSLNATSGRFALDYPPEHREVRRVEEGNSQRPAGHDGADVSDGDGGMKECMRRDAGFRRQSAGPSSDTLSALSARSGEGMNRTLS